MSKDDLNFLFLGGHRKCGTTMLLNLLDGHPELCVYPTDITMLYAYFPTYEEGDFSPSEKKDRLDAVIFDTLRGESIISEHMDIGLHWPHVGPFIGILLGPIWDPFRELPSGFPFWVPILVLFGIPFWGPFWIV